MEFAPTLIPLVIAAAMVLLDVSSASSELLRKVPATMVTLGSKDDHHVSKMRGVSLSARQSAELQHRDYETPRPRPRIIVRTFYSTTLTLTAP